MAIRVLQVEADPRLARLTAEFLQAHDVEVELEARGDRAVARCERLRPDAVLLGRRLPGLDGLAVCVGIRERSDVPIILVAGRADRADRVRGLERGADDCVAKPFRWPELLARIRAQVRRARGELRRPAARLVVGDLVVDVGARRVTLRGAPIALTATELALVAALAERAGQALGRDHLLQRMHGRDDGAFDRAIDVVVSRLRAKLERDPRHPRLVQTVRGAGYLLAGG